jgi:ubiquinone biosynthesis protein
MVRLHDLRHNEPDAPHTLKQQETSLDFNSIAKLSRFKTILMVLLKYGFDDLAQRLDLPGSRLIKKTGPAETELGTYERIRRVVEDLGPTFVKLGQIMSLRPDLLPAPLIKELSKLQDDVPPVPLEEIHKVVETSLGQKLTDVFSIFDAEPLAAASISQVHRAVLRKEGDIVSVKVQRPGIKKRMEADLDILAAIAGRLHEHSDDFKAYDLPNLVRVTRRNLLREIDFTREARNMKIAGSYQTDASWIYIPRVYDDYCFRKILVMEHIHGTKLKDVDSSNLENAEVMAKEGLKAAIKQILEDGFFHADPHPGNMLVYDGNRLCLLDWGLVGRLTENDRNRLIDLLKAIVEKDGEQMVHTLLRICSREATIDQDALERELLDIIDSYFAVPVKAMNIGQILLAITELLRVYHLRLPPDLVIMVKALVTAEGTARQIHPGLNVLSESEDYVKKLAAARYHPRKVWRNLSVSIGRMFDSQREIPKRLIEILSRISQGDLKMAFRFENLGDLINAMENSSNRMAFSIIIASLIIGSSMIITTGVGPLLFGFPAIGVIGYLISALLGLWLVFNIIRTRKY